MSRLPNEQLQTGLPKGSLSYLQPHPTVDGYIFLHYKDGMEKWGKKGGLNPKYREANKKWRKTSRGRELRRKETRRHYKKKKSIYRDRFSKRRNMVKNCELNAENQLIMKEVFRLRDEVNLSAIAAGAFELFEVDHIWPIKQKNYCGLHVPWNAQFVTKSENRRKSNRDPREYEYVDEPVQIF